MTSSENKSVTLDEIDYAILSQLIENGRESFLTIARKLNVAPNTVSNRVKRLIKFGTIGFHTRIDPLFAQFHSTNELHVTVTPSRLIEKVALAISEYPEVSFLVMTTGDVDLLVEVMCQDQDHLLDIIGRFREIEGVEKIKTLPYLKIFKLDQPDLGKIRKQRESTENTGSLKNQADALAFR
jgi:Lrp/AsnC family transcriptional regulator for asnA, asnC and gidA